MTKLSRRDTLKLIGSFTAGALLQGVQPLFQGRGGIELEKPNIIFLVIDTLSARHLSLYGYERHTTTNLERFASRASVYHNHYAGGNFTTPGTATILTGHYPWSHRAINMGAPVSSRTVADNLFSLVGQGRSNVAFTQNLLVEVLFEQFSQAIQKHIPHVSYYRQLKSPDIMSLFSRDPLTAHYALDDFLIHSKVTSSPVPGSAYFGYLDMLFEQSRRTWSLPSSEYPRGMPATDKYFYDNREVYAGLFEMTQTLEKQSQPYLAYFHLLSPHSPYSAHRDYIDIFPAIKVRAIKRHKLANHVRQAELIQFRTYYDEYIADVDAQFGMLYDNLNDAGILDHSYFIVTSDHGELFERGESGHVTPLLFDSVIHVPLLISAPQQTGRRDFYTRTSNVDLLPTLLALDGGQIPASLEGKILPGFGGPEEENRSIFSLEAKSNSAFGPLKHATVTLMKENHKIIYYGDYPRYSNVFEFYDLEHDPEERNDLFAGGPVAAGLMKEELLDTLSTVNKPYMNPKSS